MSQDTLQWIAIGALFVLIWVHMALTGNALEHIWKRINGRD